MRRILVLAATVPLAACGQTPSIGSGGADAQPAEPPPMSCTQTSGGAASLHSLYSGPAPRPGPDLLYRALEDAPQLENRGIWQAPPILISGASAYRCGEFLYQDYLYDDHGAKEVADPTDPAILALGQIFNGHPAGALGSGAASLPSGTYTYPTGATYAHNAADLVEFRVKPTADATAFRITLNTLIDPSVVAFTIALGGTAGDSVAWPDGANVSAPGDLFLTVHGDVALLQHQDGTSVSGPAPSVSIDMQRRQYTLLLPHADWQPRGVERIAMGVGLWNAAKGSYLLPQAVADATHPGGGGTATKPAAFFNVAFRYNAQEPFPDLQGLLSAIKSAAFDPAWWRDAAQAKALAAHDISGFFAAVDFDKLSSGASDDMPDQPTGVPRSGAMDRILASHFETEQGIDYSVFCGTSSDCKGELRGRLQPYAVYVPAGPAPAGGWGLTLLLHSLGANYNQFSASRNQSQFGARGNGSIVITPEGRGTDGWYYDYAGADTFEAWADIAARYPLDPARTVIAGYSMGGYGTYKLATQFPDLFARAQPTVGPPGLGVWLPPVPPVPGGTGSNTNRMLASLRNVPILIWDGLVDELVPIAGPQAQAAKLGTLGYRYKLDVFATADHLALAINDEFQPAADFLGDAPVDYDPPHVTYVYNPAMDFAGVGTAAGHAYWVSGLKLRDASGSALGTIDVRSEGFGVGDPVASGTSGGTGTLGGGALGSMAYTSQTQTWGAAPTAPVADQLDITATNIATVTIDPARAQVDCNAQLNVDSDGPLKVTLSGCP